MLGLPSIGLTKTLKDGTQAVSTTFEAANRIANTVNLTAQLAEERMKFEVKKQSLLQDKRLKDIENSEIKKNDEGQWEFA